MSASPPSNGAILPLPAAQLPFPADTASCVLIIQHSDRVPPAFVSSFLQERGVPSYVLHIDWPGAMLPQVEQPWKAIVSLGGPQGSYEDAQHAWMPLEKAFLVAHVRKGTPVLGICLGCQMLAHALGGNVYPAKHFEAGYVNMQLTEEGKQDEMVQDLFQQLSQVEPSADTSSHSGFLMHHGDTYDLPSFIPNLANTSFKALWRYGSAVGTQFHPEAGLSEIQQWTAFVRPERYEQAGTNAEQLVESCKQKQAAANKSTRIFFDTWWKWMVEKQQPQPASSN